MHRTPSRADRYPISSHGNHPLTAKVALKLLTTAKQITGLTIYEIVTNLAIDIFSSSSAPLTSARAVSFVAEGPVGRSIRTNQRTGSSSRNFVFEAKR